MKIVAFEVEPWESDVVNQWLDIYERDTTPVINYFTANYPDQTYCESVDKLVTQIEDAVVSDLQQSGLDIALKT